MDAASCAPVPAAHLRLASLRAVLALLRRAALQMAPLAELVARFPALQRPLDAAAAAGLEGRTLDDAVSLLDGQLWPPAAPALPLRRLRDALGLDAAGLDLFVLCGALDEDRGLAPLVDTLGGQEGRATRALLAAGGEWALEALLAHGLLVDSEAARGRTLHVPPAVWEAAHGRSAGHMTCEVLTPASELILPAGLPPAARQARVCWALRGLPGSGRRALAGAIAREAGLGMLERPGLEGPQLAACALLLHAMPLLDIEPAPGECAHLPALPAWNGPVAARLPPHGGLAAAERALRWIELDLPGPEERLRHWQRALRRDSVDPVLAELRLPRGRIHRIARGTAGDAKAVLAAVDAEGAFLLDGLAHRVPPLGPDEALALADEAQQEFDVLLARCRHRETLPGVVPAAFPPRHGVGVRALFKGPSGTGKTLAARQLATALGRPLYRLSLAGTVSKYVGETQRNLERAFAAAEALDIVLLLDEGDALMAGRTGVANANDRYANLETNYLLQRLEHYDGILVITTNAPERIDAAFARRMDATLEFALPDARTRYRLWHAQLPRGHRIGGDALEEAASRCQLSGGQIRNAALHATLLAIADVAGPGEAELAAALHREYRRAGQACPSLRFAEAR